MQLLSFRPEWRIRRAGTPPDRLHCPLGNGRASRESASQISCHCFFLILRAPANSERCLPATAINRFACYKEWRFFNRQAAGRDELRLVPKFLERHRGRPSRAPLLGILLRHALLQVAGETRAFAYAQEFVPLFWMRLAIVCELKVR